MISEMIAFALGRRSRSRRTFSQHEGVEVTKEYDGDDLTMTVYIPANATISPQQRRILTAGLELIYRAFEDPDNSSILRVLRRAERISKADNN